MNFLLWNAFPQLSLDMTCEANWTGAFYKHLIYDFHFIKILAAQSWSEAKVQRFILYLNNVIL